jgi:hypothetical protein
MPKLSYISVAGFYGCYSLSTLSFPLLTGIGNNAFSGCTNLESIYLFNSIVASMSQSAFYGTNLGYSKNGKYASIFVRKSLLSAWKSASYWSAYSARFVGLTNEEIVELDEENS